MLKYFKSHSRSLRGHYEVTSGLIKNTPFQLKFDMNDPQVDLSMLKYLRCHSMSLRGHYEVTSGLFKMLQLS